MDKKTVLIPAGVFKQKCLAILDEVAESHSEITVTKRGIPVARVVPLESDHEIESRVLSQLRGGDGGNLINEQTLIEPTSNIAEWPEA